MAIKQKDIRAILENEEKDIDSKIRDILNLVHSETDALRDEKDVIQQELDKTKTDLTAAQSGKEKAEQDLTDYKNAQAAKDTLASKESAYRAAALAAGVSEKRIETVLRAAKAEGKLDALELENGKAKDETALADSIKTDWADFIVSTKASGADTPKPPKSIGGATITKEQIMAIKDGAERRKAIAENPELFGLEFN